MDLSKILTISGKNGLFTIVSQSKANLIVESLIDGKKIPVFATDRSSALSDISVFTYGEDLPLKEILIRIHNKENGSNSIDPKAKPEDLRSYFETIVPDYDKERVYHSDMKKIFSWYNLLLEKGIMKQIVESASEEDKVEEESVKKEPGEKADKASSVKKPVKPASEKKSRSEAKPAVIDTGRRKTMQKKQG